MNKKQREEKHDQLQNEIIPSLERKAETLHQYKRRLGLLVSVSYGLYDEIDKLCKKTPAEPLTDLALEQVNDVIGEIKEIGQSDPYVQKLKQFVAAGDNPQHRDAVVVLRQVKQALSRLSNDLDAGSKLTNEQISEAQTLIEVLGLRADLPKEELTDELLDEYAIEVAAFWRDGPPDSYRFDFEKLEETDLARYFTQAS